MAKRVRKINGHHWTESGVFEALEAHYCGAEKWVIVPQIPDATSFNKCRTCDAMAFHCWRSEGIAVHGFEIKVSRADWLNELQKPEKSEGFIKRSHYWWIAAPENIVKLEELPATWGLRVVSKNEDGTYSSRVKRPATYNANATWDVHFIVALARACYQKSPDRQVDQKMVSEAFERGRQAGMAEANVRRPGELTRSLTEVSRLRDKIAEFEAKSGIDMSSWNGGNLAKHLAAIKRLGNPYNGMRRLEESLEGLGDALRQLALPPGERDPRPVLDRIEDKVRKSLGLKSWEQIPEAIQPPQADENAMAKYDFFDDGEDDEY